MHVGFIGLGAMRHSMAGHLHSRGVLAVVGNRTQARAQIFADALTLKAAAGAGDFSGCDVVMLCVSADADVLENVRALAGVLRAGSVVVDHSTVSSTTAQQAQALLQEH